MTSEQFYYCLSRILELRQLIKEAQTSLRPPAAESSEPGSRPHYNFETLKSDNLIYSDRDAAEIQAQIKELAAQEAKIRSIVPVSYYGTSIEATHGKLVPLYVIVQPHKIVIKKAQ